MIRVVHVFSQFCHVLLILCSFLLGIITFEQMKIAD